VYPVESVVVLYVTDTQMYKWQHPDVVARAFIKQGTNPQWIEEKYVNPVKGTLNAFQQATLVYMYSFVYSWIYVFITISSYYVL